MDEESEDAISTFVEAKTIPSLPVFIHGLSLSFLQTNTIQNDSNRDITKILDNNTTKILLSDLSKNQTLYEDDSDNQLKLFNWSKAFLVFIFCALIVITIIGNTLVILAVITTRRLRTITNCFVMSLAVADLLVGIFVMPPAVAVHIVGFWQLGWILCDIWISLDVLLCTASILNLCAISIDRYLAVTQPLTYSRKRRSKRLALSMILAVWILALAITCPPILGWYEPGRRNEVKECRYNQNEGYVIFSAMGSFFIPMAVMIYVYARISCVVATRHDSMADIEVRSQKCGRNQLDGLEEDPDEYIPALGDKNSDETKRTMRTLSDEALIKDLERNLNESHEMVNVTHTCSIKRQPSILTKSTTTNIENWPLDRTQSFKTYHHHTTTVINHTTRTGRTHQKSFTSKISSSRKENKTTQTLSIVVGGFIACWLPFFVNYLVTPFLPLDSVSATWSAVLTWLGWFNSAINPFIYAFYSIDFRVAFWRLTLKRLFKNSTLGQFPSHSMSIRR